MGYDFDPSSQGAISGKKLAILFIISVIGAILFLQFLFGFPLLDVFRREVTEEATVIIKNDETCVVETSDHPRTIANCQYNLGDKLQVTYIEGTEPIKEHSKKH